MKWIFVLHTFRVFNPYFLPHLESCVDIYMPFLMNKKPRFYCKNQSSYHHYFSFRLLIHIITYKFNGNRYIRYRNSRGQHFKLNFFASKSSNFWFPLIEIEIQDVLFFFISVIIFKYILMSNKIYISWMLSELEIQCSITA